MKGIKSSHILLPNGVFSGYLYFNEGKILEITQQERSVEILYDMHDAWVSPGFIDIHTHGGGGHSFSGSTEEVVAGCHYHLAHGTTSICPTVSADHFEVMAEAVSHIEEAMTHPDLQSCILGAHLEGPYLSLSQSGAQGTQFITPPNAADYLQLLESHGQSIARWSYAPENDANCSFVKALSAHNVVPSAGHTDALYSDIKSAMNHGCRLVTHLYSCTSTITRDHGFRRLGVIESAWLEDDLFVEIIADGKHLPPDLLRMIYKLKGSDRIILVTDSLALAGTEAKQGVMQSTPYIIEDGVCKLLDRSAFAGSIATADRLVRVMVQDAGVSIPEAVKMITETPATIMNLSHKGRLAPGCDADIIVFDDNIHINHVFVNGKLSKAV